MILTNGQKYACIQCIRGHRASSCNHADRPLNLVRRKGRPPTQCNKCRELRRTRKAHVKCLCAEIKTTVGDTPTQTALALPTLPTKLQSLLNPCSCNEQDFCTCCEPRFSEYLKRKYPSTVVELEARSLGESLKRPRTIAAAATESSSGSNDTVNECPTGPDAPCCKMANNGSSSVGSSGDSSIHYQPAARAPQLGQCNGQKTTQMDDNWQPIQSMPQNADGRLLQAIPQTQPLSHTQQPTESERPNCACGCDCSLKLDMLIRAIETRMGRQQQQEPAPAMNQQLSGSEPQWVQDVLSPLASEHTTLESMRPLLPAISATRSTGMSAGGTGSDMSSAPSSAVRPAFELTATQMRRSRSRSSSGASLSSTNSAVRIMTLDSRDNSPGGVQRRRGASEASDHMSGTFATGVVPPITGAPQCSSLTSECLTTQNVLPQQVLPATSCCGGRTLSSSTSSGEQTACCASGSGSTCACCRRGGWKPGDPSKPEVDVDGALACNCGCHKPFAECTDCIKDECEELLLGPSL
ncbi:copper-binding transcription factor [Coemansia sp. RSA 988]|nr:copper-binding transcription factor [Coemansia sp. RSA 988]